MTRLVLVVAIVAVFVGNALALDVPALNGRRVNDNASLLTHTQRNALEQELRSLEERTGAQVALLIIPDLQGEDMAAFSHKTAVAWALGQKGKDNGLLIVYEVAGDHSRVEVGYGLEGAIPDGLAGDIIRQDFRSHAPKHGTKNFGAGFAAMVQRIDSIITAEYTKDPTGKSMEKQVDEGGVIVVLVILALVFILVAGIINEILGAAVGCFSGAGLGIYLPYGVPGIVILIIVGGLIGLVIKKFAEAVADGDFAGGSYGSYSGGGGGFGSSSDGGGGFSGGGGGFGGGGAGD